MRSYEGHSGQISSASFRPINPQGVNGSNGALNDEEEEALEREEAEIERRGRIRQETDASRADNDEAKGGLQNVSTDPSAKGAAPNSNGEAKADDSTSKPGAAPTASLVPAPESSSDDDDEFDPLFEEMDGSPDNSPPAQPPPQSQPPLTSQNFVGMALPSFNASSLPINGTAPFPLPNYTAPAAPNPSPSKVVSSAPTPAPEPKKTVEDALSKPLLQTTAKAIISIPSAFPAGVGGSTATSNVGGGGGGGGLDLPTLSNDVLLTSSIGGEVLIWDRRVNDGGKGIVRKIDLAKGIPPWSASVRGRYVRCCMTHSDGRISFV